jgi:hypothetical protein
MLLLIHQSQVKNFIFKNKILLISLIYSNTGKEFYFDAR